MNSDSIAIEAATDGACSGNPGPGGWGGLIIFDDKSELEIGGSKKCNWSWSWRCKSTC